jgi:chromosomal replication initiator protein
VDWKQGRLVLSVPQRYTKQWIENHFWAEMRSAAILAAQETGESTELQIELQVVEREGSSGRMPVVNSAMMSEGLTIPGRAATPRTERSNHTDSLGKTLERVGLALPSILPDDRSAFTLPQGKIASQCRLENFLPSPQTKVAYEALLRVALHPGHEYNPVLIHGKHGLGKTHLLLGVAQALKENIPHLRILHLSGEEFANAFLNALQSKRLESFRNEFRNCHALLIDDVHFLAGKDKSQEEFLHTLDSLRHSGRQIVMTSIAPPREIPRLDPRLVERFQSGLVVRVAPPNPETRANLIQAKARARGHEIPQEVAQFLAVHLERSVRELEGAVCKLSALAAAEGKAPDQSLALMALRELGYVKEGPLSLGEIMSAVCTHLKVSEDQLRSDKRHAQLVRARHIAMFLCKDLTEHSLGEIGGFYGNRDHSTVLHAVRKVGKDLKKDEEMRQDLHVIRRSLGR